MLRLSLLRAAQPPYLAATWAPAVAATVAATVVAAVIMVTATRSFAQQGPIRLFPQMDPPATPAPQATPEEQRALPSDARPGPAVPPPEFVVEGLAAPEVDAIGLAVSGGGFDRASWQGSDPRVLQALLVDLPVVTELPPLRRLARRLLVTASPVAGGDGRLLAARVGRLVAMGDLDAAKLLLDQLPPMATDSDLARSAAEVALLLGEEDRACQLADAIGPTTKAEYWGKVGVYCRLAAGDAGAARLGLELLREARQTADTGFFALASAIADDADGPPAQSLPHPSAIHTALLALAEWPLPPEALAGASPPVLAAVMRAPALAGGHRLAVAEQAFLVGAASADQLAGLYVEQADADTTDVMWRIRSDWSPTSRALAYQAVREERDPLARAQLLDALWRAADGAERFQVAETFAVPLAELAPERALAAMAPSIGPALLAADRLVPAGRWLSLLDAAAREDARLRGAASGMVPLFALAGIGGSDAVPRLDAAAIDAWTPAADDGIATERLLAMLDGVGAPLAAEVWGRLLPAHAERRARAPASALWRGLEDAAAGRRVGETVLYALTMLEGRPQAVHPEALVVSLRALRQVGLDRDARAIAVATALIDGG